MRWERVHTAAGWHLRGKGDNGEIVLTTEVYSDPRSVEEALAMVSTADAPELHDVDETGTTS